MIATICYAAASHIVEWAEDRVDIGLGMGKTKPADKARLTRLSEALRKASEANLSYFDNVILKERAEKEGVSMAVITECLYIIRHQLRLRDSRKQERPHSKRKTGQN